MRVLIAIASCRRDARNGFNQGVRDTWLTDIRQHPTVDYKFFIGDDTPTDDDEAAIWESQRGTSDSNRGIDYEAKGIERAKETAAELPVDPQVDEVILPVPDDYVHLAVKVREIFRWAYTQGYDFVFKCDVDTYVDIARLMRSGFEKYDFIGGPNGRNVAGGSGWWVSRKTMSRVIEARINCCADDSWFPTLAQAKGIVLKHDVRYSDNDISPYNNIITTHAGFKAGYTPSRMHALRKAMQAQPFKALIAVSSWVTGATNGDNQAIRETYAQDVDHKILDHRFFIGNGTPVSVEDESRLEDSVTHATRGHKHKAISTKIQDPFTYTPQEDEVVLDCPDGYLYLGHKTWHSHRWALDHGYDYIFQCFPDTFIDIPKLMDSGFEDTEYTGHQCGGSGAKYASGGAGYWLSKKATELVLTVPVNDWAEDRWVGRSLAPFGILLKHDPRYGRPTDRPHRDNDFITSHLCDTPNVYNNQVMRDAYAVRNQDTPSAAPAKYRDKSWVDPKYRRGNNGNPMRPPLRQDLVVDWFTTHPRGPK
jgi:hypothetical protein